jgi:hypothetical protein
MKTLTRTMSAVPGPDTQAHAAWRRRVARIGSEIQLAFATLWFARGTLATGWPGRLPICITLAAGAVAVGIWGAAATRGLAPRPHGPAARRLERAITIATVIQLAASCALPVAVSAAGRSDLTVTTVAITIGLLLLWLWARLRTVGHLTAGILLIVIPGILAVVLAGNTLTAAAGLATAVILTASAIIGFRALARGTLGPDDSPATPPRQHFAPDCGNSLCRQPAPR